MYCLELMMKLKEFSFLLKTAVASGADKALAATCPLQSRVTKAEAYRRYGRYNVDRWQREGLIQLNSVNPSISKKTFDREKLESIAASSNRVTYLPVAER
jgi:hypothetical protein